MKQHCVSRIILLLVNRLVGKSEFSGVLLCDIALSHVSQGSQHASRYSFIPISKELFSSTRLNETGNVQAEKLTWM